VYTAVTTQFLPAHAFWPTHPVAVITVVFCSVRRKAGSRFAGNLLFVVEERIIVIRLDFNLLTALWWPISSPQPLGGS
jgi:hypothetical protein